MFTQKIKGQAKDKLKQRTYNYCTMTATLFMLTRSVYHEKNHFTDSIKSERYYAASKYGL